MFIELVDHLRCIRPHEDAWLVAASYRMDERHILDGVLGCPVCRAEYPVRDGVVDLTAGAAQPAPHDPATDDPRADGDEALRLAALLHLLDVRAPVLLGGRWSGCAPTLAEAVPAAFLLLNPAPQPARHPALSTLLAAGTVPIAAGALHAAALDATLAADPGVVAAAARALRPRGRLVAPAAAPLPEGLVELARDERHWVAESSGPPSAPIGLARAPGR